MTEESMAARTHEVEIDNSNRSTAPTSERFLAYIMSNWAERPELTSAPRDSAQYAAHRRAVLAAQFPGRRLVIEAGSMKQRSNDTFYPFRAHSAFSHLTGWGADSEPGAVLVLDPVDGGHDATLYFRERAGRDTEEFFKDSEIGEFWIGARPSLGQVAADLSLATSPLASFVPGQHDVALEDEDFARATSELRLVKDAFEIAEMQTAVDATSRGFDDVLASLGDAIAHRRGERIVEGAFNNRARLDGNGTGYETIAASGANACTLHWIRNDGAVRNGDLLLLDAGVELDSLYTADITRTVPVSGKFSPVQLQVYNAVLEAADAARSIVRPGIRFHEVHSAAMSVIETYTRKWGLLPEPAPAEQVAYHRRFMVHGTSHHLGLDVHDCSQARRELYLDGVLEAGMIFTIEPGLYFQADDLSVPEGFRGIGVRIEDDIVVTEDGCVNLSAHIPREAAAVEDWVQRFRR